MPAVARSLAHLAALPAQASQLDWGQFQVSNSMYCTLRSVG